MEDFGSKVRNVIHFFIAVFIVTLIVVIIGLLMLKYDVEGENNMPFELSQMVVVSTAEGINIDGEKMWNFNLVQNNDIYLNISKNKNYNETEIIKSIEINNIKIEDEPKKGNIVIYRPSRDENKTYEYIEEYKVEDSIVYTGSENENFKELQVANQGGVISFRCSNQNLRRVFIR